MISLTLRFSSFVSTRTRLVQTTDAKEGNVLETLCVEGQMKTDQEIRLPLSGPREDVLGLWQAHLRCWVVRRNKDV